MGVLALPPFPLHPHPFSTAHSFQYQRELSPQDQNKQQHELPLQQLQLLNHSDISTTSSPSYSSNTRFAPTFTHPHVPPPPSSMSSLNTHPTSQSRAFSSASEMSVSLSASSTASTNGASSSVRSSRNNSSIYHMDGVDAFNLSKLLSGRSSSLSVPGSIDRRMSGETGNQKKRERKKRDWVPALMRLCPIFSRTFRSRGYRRKKRGKKNEFVERVLLCEFLLSFFASPFFSTG